MEPTNENPSKIERIVMQRVHLIRALRFAISSGVFSTLLSALALWGIGTQVWVGRVLQNSPKDIFALPQFYISAFLHTHFIVQVLVVLTIVALIFLAREIFRAVSILSPRENF